MSLNLPVRTARVRIDPALAIVNVVLLLIFFFLVSGREQRALGDLELSQTSQLPNAALPSPVLELHPSGDWLLDGQPVQPDLLAAALPDGEAPVHVMIDRDAPAHQLMDLLRRPELAARPLRLVTLRAVDP
ncbi:ExbD/TolR family protein [Paracoccus sp. Ld10]|uniref:ExbD/TolR family protein n=1 Tax=Paracoccus sp. Ld10 TaxID=649158 RepID=UPI0038655EEC